MLDGDRKKMAWEKRRKSLCAFHNEKERKCQRDLNIELEPIIASKECI